MIRSARTAVGYADTKVVATIGPACEPKLGELIEAGLSVARINFSHGDHAEHRRRIAAVRRAAEERGAVVGILADIQGPKLRMGLFDGGARRVSTNERLRLAEGGGLAAADQVLFNVEGFLAALAPGHRVLLADGLVELVVEAVGTGEARARVVRGGPIGDRKGFHLPDSDLAVELPTPKDRADIVVACELEVDMLGVSFVASAADVETIRELAPACMIVSKIERALAVQRIDEIVAASDGIMVARGDLGVETELEKLPLLQKSLIRSAFGAGKFAITATEMLESMIHSPRPTRAEVSDVANAVLDGTDAVMLSAETAVGSYPVEAVATMVKICRAVETSQYYADLPRIEFRSAEAGFSNATAHAAVEAADALGVRYIVCFTESGNTARLISRYRPRADIVALSPNPRTLHLMAVLAHVRPLPLARQKTLEDMLWAASQLLLERKLVDFGDDVVFVSGVPPGVTRATNVMKVHKIGEPIRMA